MAIGSARTGNNRSLAIHPKGAFKDSAYASGHEQKDPHPAPRAADQPASQALRRPAARARAPRPITDFTKPTAGDPCPNTADPCPNPGERRRPWPSHAESAIALPEV